MSCIIPAEKLKSVLLKALQNDFTRYAQLKNVAADVITRSLPDEAKVNALVGYAMLFRHLSSKSELYTTEGLDTIILDNLSGMIDEPSADYAGGLQLVGDNLQKLLGISVESPSFDVNTYAENAADKFSTHPLVGLKAELDKLIADVIDKARSGVITIQQAADILNDTYSSIQVNQNVLNNEYAKRRFQDFRTLLNRAIETVTAPGESSYVDIRELEGFGKDRFLLYAPDGNVYELAKTGENYFYVDTASGNVTDVLVPQELLGNVRSVVNTSNAFIANDGVKRRVSLDELNSGLTIMRADMQALQDEFSGAAGSMNGMVRIVASRSAVQVNAERRQRLMQLALTNPGLAKRNFETMESPAQALALRNGKMVLTTLRPVEGFTLMLETPTGRRIPILTHDTYAFVYPDNTIVPVDFENPEHVQQFAAMAETQGGEQLQPIDLVGFRDNLRKLRAFQAEVNAFLEDSMSAEIPQQLFNKYFSLQSNIDKVRFVDSAERGVAGPLQGFIDTYGGTYEVSVVSPANPEGVNKNLPLIYHRTGKKGSHVWTTVDMLAADERISLNGDEYTWGEYVDHFVRPGIESQKNMSMSAYLGKLDSPTIMLANVNGTTQPLFVRAKSGSEDAAGRASFMMALLSFRNNFDAASGDKKYSIRFNNEEWGFNITGHMASTIFAGDSSRGRYVGISFEALEGYPGMELFNQNRSKLTIAIPDNTYGEINRKVGEYLKAAGHEGIDLSTPQGMERAAQILDNAFKSASMSAEASKLMDDINQMYSKMTQEIDKLFQKRLADFRKSNETLNLISEKFYHTLFNTVASDITVDGKVVRNTTPELRLVNRAIQRKGVENFNILKHHIAHTVRLRYRTTSIPAAAAKITAAPVAAPAKVVTVAPAAVAEKVSNTPAGEKKTFKKSSVNRVDDAFSLGEMLDQVGLSEQEFQNELEYILSRLPKTIKVEDLGTIVAQLKADGRVLGYIKDKVIYLNREMSAKGTAYHEAFHAIFRYVLSDEQRAALTRQALKEMGYIPKADVEAFIQRRKLFGASIDEVFNLMAEEYMADKFRDYAINKTEPKSWLKQLFEFFKNLFEFFAKNATVIDEIFDNIHTGVYANAETKTFAGREGAFELIKTVPILQEHRGKIMQTSDTMTATEMIELKNRIIHEMSLAQHIVDGETESARYDRIAEELSREFTIDFMLDFSAKRGTEITEDLRKAVEREYNRVFRNYRYVLGALQRGEDFDVINLTKDPELDNQVISKDDDESLADAIKAYETMKRDVLRTFGELNKIDTDSVVNDMLNSDESVADPYQEDEIDQDNPESELGSAASDDVPFLETRPDRGDREFRKSFSYLSYVYQHPTLGVYMKRTTDGDLIFDALHKIAANASKEEIIPRIQETVRRMNEDIQAYNNLRSQMTINTAFPAELVATKELADSLQAVLNQLETICGTDPRDIFNVHVYEQFHRVFFKSGPTLDKVDVETSLTKVDTGETDKDNNPIYEDVVTSNMVVRDFVTRQQQFSVLNRIKENYQLNFQSLTVDQRKALSEAYQKHMKEFLGATSRITTDLGETEFIEDKYFTKVDGSFDSRRFNRFVDDLYVILSQTGLGIPRHFLYYSLAAIAKRDASEPIKLGMAEYDVLTGNKQLYNNGQYWNKYAFKQLGVLLGYQEETPFFDDANTQRKKVESALLRGTAYLLKHDPSMGMSVIYNAEGKKVYSYFAYTPPLLIAQKVEREGIRNYIVSTFGEQFLPFFNDNPYLSPDEMGDSMSSLFTDNLEVGVFAGLSQSIGEFDREGVTSRSIDDKAYALAMIGMFANRNKLMRTTSYGQKNRIQTFKRPITQFEATSTVFTVSSLYEQYMTSSKDRSVEFMGKKMPVITKNLIQVIKQEYNRIRREYMTAAEDKKIYNGYNAKLNSDGSLNTTDPSLRAYNFTQLMDFFEFKNQNSVPVEGDESNLDSKNKRVNLREILKGAALENRSFESAFADVSADLLEELGLYANEQFENMLQQLEDLQVITRQDNNGKTEIKSQFLPSVMYVDNVEVKLGSNKEIFLRDFFYNTWVNGLFVNQMFDGDVAVGVKEFKDYFKRQKSSAAAGDNAQSILSKQRGKTATRYAVIKNTSIFLDDANLTTPQSMTGQENMERPTEFDIMDGQSYTTLEHRIEFLRAKGRLDDESERIIRAARWRRLTVGEIKYLDSRKISLNSKKTVYSHPLVYIKHSEHYINRYDASRLKKGEDRQKAEARLEVMYMLNDFYRMKLEAGEVRDNNGDFYQNLYEQNMRDIHDMFEAIPGREFLHTMLNSMEMYRLDMVSDESAVKRASVMPVTIETNPDAGYGAGNSYFSNIDTYASEIPYEYGFDQVETSSHSDEVTDGIQQKLLKDTDIQLDAKLKKSNPALYNAVKTYREKQSELVKSSIKKLEKMLLDGDNVNVARVYKTMRESLEKQGADPTLLEYFALDDSGKPVHNPNLSMLSGPFTYYFFSMFSKNVFQPKMSGMKFFHASSMGYKVNINGELRYPSVIQQEDGTYVVEVLIPRQLADSKQEREVLEKAMAEFFATRIPTEDKRSMVVAKVVGYIDASYINTIIAPEQVHLWSGSDKDIDSMYAQMKGTYKDALGNRHIYGDYSSYEKMGFSADSAAFIEYLHDMAQDDVYKELVDAERKRLRETGDYQIDNLRTNGALGIFTRDVQEFFVQSLAMLGESNKDRFGDFGEKKDQVMLMDRLIAVMNVLSDAGMPMTPEALKKYEKKNGSPVTGKIQNEIIEAGNDILKNPEVYDRFMKNERSSADFYKELVARRGKNESEIINKNNFKTAAAILTARSLNSSSKDGIGIAATTNKGISLLIKSDIRVDSPVFTINHKGKVVVSDRFIHDERAHAIIGNMLGMFADAAKSPYPGPLNLNEFNIGATAMMLAMGLPKEMAVLINSVPMIKDMITEYKNNSSSAVKSPGARPISFGRFVQQYYRNQIELLRDDLIKSEVAVQNDEGFKFLENRFALNYDETQIGEGDTLTDLGFNITRDDESLIANEDVKQFYLLNRFIAMMGQSNSLRYEITQLTNAQKTLKPDFEVFDRLMAAYDNLEEVNTFTNVESILKDNPVYNNLHDAIKLMDKISGKFFLERNPVVKTLLAELQNSLFGVNKADIAAQVKGYFAMQSLKSKISKELAKKTLGENKRREFEAFKDMLSADFWNDNKIVNDYDTLANTVPGNAFVEFIRVAKVTKKASMKVIKGTSKAKLNAERSEMVSDGYKALLIHPDEAVRDAAKRLFYYSIVKDGLNRVPYGYMRFLSPALMKIVSDSLTSVQKSFEQYEKKVTRMAKKENMDDYNTVLDEMFQEAFDTPGVNAEAVVDDLLVKIISKYQADPLQANLRLINRKGWGKFANVSDDVFASVIDQLFPKTSNLIYKPFKTGGLGVVRPYKTFPGLNGKGHEAAVVDAAGVMVIDTKGGDENQAVKNKILERMSIFRTAAGYYRFPLFMTNIYGQLLVLDNIDNQKVSTQLASSMANRVLFEDGNRPIYGSVATYKAVSRQGNPEVVPYAFDKTEAEKLYEGYYVEEGEKKSMIPATPKPVNVTMNNKGGVAHSLQNKEFSKNVYDTNSGDKVVMIPAGRVKVIKGSAGLSVFIDGKKINSTADALAERFGFDSYAEMIKEPAFKQLAQNKDMFIHKVVSLADVKTIIAESTGKDAAEVNMLADEYMKMLVDMSEPHDIEEFLHDRLC